MAIWVLFGLMTFAVIIAVLWPLSRPEAVMQEGAEDDIAFYKQQTTEIDKDLARGLLRPEEAEAAKAEAGRRLLRSARTDAGVTYAAYHSVPALQRRRLASVLILIFVPLFGLCLYLVNGRPDFSELLAQSSAQQRINQQKKQEKEQEEQQIAAVIAQMEQHLKSTPDDGKGWELIAPAYVRVGRIDDALAAYEKAIALLGENSERLTGYGRALFFAARGMVFDNARAAFEKAAGMDPKADVARFYLGYAAEQDGDIAKAKEFYQEVLRISPQWTAVREHLASLDAPQPAEAGQVGPQAINAMIESLAARLDQNGGKPEEWVQLVRSYMVTGRKDKALEAVEKARKALAANANGLAIFEENIRSLKLVKGDGK